MNPPSRESSAQTPHSAQALIEEQWADGRCDGGRRGARGERDGGETREAEAASRVRGGDERERAQASARRRCCGHGSGWWAGGSPTHRSQHAAHASRGMLLQRAAGATRRARQGCAAVGGGVEGKDWGWVCEGRTRFGTQPHRRGRRRRRAAPRLAPGAAASHQASLPLDSGARARAAARGASAPPPSRVVSNAATARARRGAAPAFGGGVAAAGARDGGREAGRSPRARPTPSRIASVYRERPTPSIVTRPSVSTPMSARPHVVHVLPLASGANADPQNAQRTSGEPR